MTRASVPAGRRKQQDASPPSTRELVADAAFCEVLASDMGLKTTTVRSALIGEPKVRCIRVVEWVMRNAPEDAERRAKLLLWWARKCKAGAFREDNGDDTTLAGILNGDDEQERAERLARALAQMWVENPESLAGAIRALEQSRNNGRS